MAQTLAQTYQPTAWTYADIIKSEKQEDGSILVYGRPTKEELDVDFQIADKQWAKKALPDWYKWANIREMHTASAVGTGEKLEFDENDDPFIQARIIDPVAITKVEGGVYKGFSIGIKDPVVQKDLEALNGRIIDGKIVEISLVDRPAVSSAKFTLVKMVGKSEYMDMQSGFALKLTKTNPTDGTELNPEDFDEEGNPIEQPGHLKEASSEVKVIKSNLPDLTESADLEIISQDTHTVTVKAGDKVYQVPIDMDSQGNIVVGDAEEVPGILPAEGTTGNPEAAAPASSMKGVSPTAKKTMADSGVSFERMQQLAKQRMDVEHIGQDHWHHTEATFPDKVITSCGWDSGGQLYAVPFEWLDTADGDADEDDYKVGNPYPVETQYTPKGKVDEKTVMGVLNKSAQILGKSVWSTEDIDNLPDESFAHIEPGGEKDEEGKTKPRSLRHLPYKDAEGKVDKAHVKNALGRLDQTDIPEDAKAKAKKKLESAAKEVGIEVEDVKKPEDEKNAVATLVKAAMETVTSQKVLCQTCRKSVTITKALSATPLDGGTRVQAIGDCGHTVSKFVKAAEPEKKDPEPKSAGKEADPPAKPQDKTDPNRHGGDNQDPESEKEDAELAKKFDKWARAAGLIKDANPDDAAKVEETRKKKIQDLRDAHKTLGDKIEEYDKCTSGNTEKAANSNGGPSRVEGPNPKEIIAELKGELKRMESMIDAGEGELEHAAGEGGDGNLGEKPIPPGTKPPGDGRINFTAGDIKAVVADAVKASLSVQAEVNKGVTPDLAKSVAEAVKGVLEPLASRLDKVEHMAQPSPFLMGAEKQYALNPVEENHSVAVKNVQAEMLKLSPKAREQVLAAAIAKSRGWEQ